MTQTNFLNQLKKVHKRSEKLLEESKATTVAIEKFVIFFPGTFNFLRNTGNIFSKSLL